MYSLGVLLLVTTAAAADGSRATQGAAEAAYQRDRQAFYALKADPQARKQRDRWLSAAARFEATAARFPSSPRAPQALYTAAELRNEVSHLSLVPADRRAALSEYHRLADRYPASSLADDALFQAARMELDRENDPASARKDLAQLLAQHPRGDMVHRARALLASLKAPADVAPAVAHEETKASEDETPDVPDADGAEAEAASPGTSAMTPTEVAVHPEPVEGRTAAQLPTPTPLRSLRRVGASPRGVSLAVQMGLGVHRVVIDAGHGGRDFGAIGPGGTREKDVTLAMAQKLAEQLQAQGLEVLLSRDEDEFVTLEERARFANDHRADLFISIHANANSDRRVQGTQTYFLNATDDRYALRLAARENASTEKSISDLQLILADLATKANVEESHQLAESVQREMVKELGHDFGAGRNLGVKHALFYVLLGVRMPAILVETAFVSNPAEERRLKSEGFQAAVARDIASGVSRFLKSRTAWAEVTPLAVVAKH
jgi:N-acetylmuramoyl-L-alanine amidase